MIFQATFELCTPHGRDQVDVEVDVVGLYHRRRHSDACHDCPSVVVCRCLMWCGHLIQVQLSRLTEKSWPARYVSIRADIELLI